MQTKAKNAGPGRRRMDDTNPNCNPRHFILKIGRLKMTHTPMLGFLRLSVFELSPYGTNEQTDRWARPVVIATH